MRTKITHFNGKYSISMPRKKEKDELVNARRRAHGKESKTILANDSCMCRKWTEQQR
jgi:hypothetical protein